MKLKIKRLRDNAKLPNKAYDTDTGYDVYASKVEYDLEKRRIFVFTGIAVEPEPDFYVEVFPRSSVYNKKAQLANSVGVIDFSYRGEVILVFDMLDSSFTSLWKPDEIKVGEKIAQLIIRKRYDADIEEVDDLSSTSRGEKGFGSSGK